MKKIMFGLLKGISVIGAILGYALIILISTISMPFVMIWCLVVRVIIQKDDVRCTYTLKGAFIRPSLFLSAKITTPIMKKFIKL